MGTGITTTYELYVDRLKKTERSKTDVKICDDICI